MSATLKSELKAFEREFKAQHGRNPTKDDIKARPEIGRCPSPPVFLCALDIPQTTLVLADLTHICAALKYKSYSSRRSQTPVPSEPESSTNAPPAAQPPPVASTSNTNHASAHLQLTPQKKSTTSRPPEAGAAPSLPTMSPSKARAAAVFSARSPAGKAANPFASALKDTPRTSARRYLSGAMPTPEKKRNLFSSWKDTGAMAAKPAGGVGDPSATAALNLPDFNVFRVPSVEPTSHAPTASTSSTAKSAAPAPAPAASAASMFFDPARGKRATHSLTPFDADRKRSTSIGPGAESDVSMSQDAHQPKKPRLSGKNSSTAAAGKDRQKGKGKASKRQQQPESDVTMGEEGAAEANLVRPTTRSLEDGTLVMSFKDDDGHLQEVRVRDYHPFKNASFDPDEDEAYHWRHPSQRAASTEPGSSATSVMDADPSDIPSTLVSLLSINNSPTKKHRRHVARTKELMYKQVLQEPSLKGAPAAGLLELAQEQEDRASASAGSGGWTSTADGGEVGDDEGESSGDDDWDSEPEGWKDLGGTDLTGLDDLDDERMLL